MINKNYQYHLSFIIILQEKMFEHFNMVSQMGTLKYQLCHIGIFAY